MSLAEQLIEMGFDKSQMYALTKFYLHSANPVFCYSDHAINVGKSLNMEQAIDW